MKPEDKIRNLIDKSNAGTDFRTDQRILADALEHMEMTVQKDPAPSRWKIWRTIMKGKTAKLAAAAVILTGVLVLTSVFVGTSENAVLAGVLERVEQAQAFAYKMRMTTTGNLTPGVPSEQEVAVTVSNEYGVKWDMA
ncbi:MAG: hypothetical protein AMJ65_16885, partial [Phycisphaerae bacterium SG8_4]